MPSLQDFRVAIINPPVDVVSEPSYDEPDYPHIGLASLGAYLLSKGMKPVLIDAKLERLKSDATLARIRELRPDLVGFTGFTHEVERSAALAARIRKVLPGITIALGGVHATATEEGTLRDFPEFDISFMGEGEETLWETCGRIRAGEPLDRQRGLCSRSGGAVVKGPENERITDLDDLPVPAYELMPLANVRRFPIMTARGCPYGCNFCMRPYGKSVNAYSPEHVIRELKRLRDAYGASIVNFYDETFLVDRKRSDRILDLAAAEDVARTISWTATTHAATVDRPVMAAMKRAGCVKVSIGAESGDPDLMKATGKGTSMDQVRQAFRIAREAGLKVEGFFILGHPGETRATIEKTIRFATELNPDDVAFGIMVPYPGTGVAEIAARGEGGYKLLSTSWSDYNKQVGKALEIAGLPRHVLERYQLTAYLSVFLKNRRFLDLARFSWERRREGMTFLRNFLRPAPKALASPAVSPG
ncbi:MAG: radical SAM protein [Acidobacteriota bacterium]